MYVAEAALLGAVCFVGQEVSAESSTIDFIDTSAIQTAIMEALTVEIEIDLSNNLVSEVTVEYKRSCIRGVSVPGEQRKWLPG